MSRARTSSAPNAGASAGSRGSSRATGSARGAGCRAGGGSTRGPAPLACGEDVAPDADTVIMLSASWCGYCRAARRWLQAEGIAHCEYDVETTREGQRRFAALPHRVVPVFEIRSDTLFGFNRTEIEQTLIAHGLAEFGD